MVFWVLSVVCMGVIFYLSSRTADQSSRESGAVLAWLTRLLGDATKLRELTGWAPQYTFEQGLAATIEFLRGNLDQYKVGQYIL